MEYFLWYMDQMVADIKAGWTMTLSSYHAFNDMLFDRAEAVESLRYYRSEATRMGRDPEEVVMLRDPLLGGWVVLIPTPQFEQGLREVFGFGLAVGTLQPPSEVTSFGGC